MTPLRVLVVEDSEQDTALLLRELRKGGYTPEYKRVETPSEMRDALEKQTWDVVISDFTMPHFGGLEALKLLQETGLDIPFIMVSGTIGEDTAVEAMKAGAQDYFMKDKVKRLVPAIQRELAEAEGRRQRAMIQQDRLKAYERLAYLGKLSGSIAHELRNPLATIGSSVFYLQNKLKDADDSTQKHLRHIEDAVDLCSCTIQNLLNEARVRDAQLTDLDLKDTIENIIARSQIPGTVEIERHFPGDAVLVRCDPELLGIACGNIITNAVQAMNGSGKLTVSISADEKHGRVSFTDTGPGITEENLPKLFGPLFTTKPNGVGFGLSVARMVVGKQGGTIEVESEEGVGATFTISLPLAGVQAQKPQEGVSP